MIISRKIISIFILFLAVTSHAMTKNLYDESQIEYSRNKKLYKTVVINSIENRNKEGALTYRISVNAIEKNNFGNMRSPSGKQNPENLLWDISTELPLTEAQCNAAYADLCDKELNKLYKGSCFKPCISYGPEPLDFDEKNKKLYFSVASASIGTGGGPYFIFVGDINKKEIKFLKAIKGPIVGTLSPQGTYLLLVGMSKITIYNTITGKELYISEPNNWSKENMRLHYFSNITWLSDTKFSYYDGISNSSFKKSFEEVKENIYDISLKSVIQSRVLSKNEIDRLLLGYQISDGD